MPRASLAILLGLSLVLSGCAALVARDEDGPETTHPRCEHPWPCGDGSEWPVDLSGPFDILPHESVRVKSFDGTELDGAVWRPKLPEGVRAPVVVKSTPYLGTCSYQSIRGGGPSCSGSPNAPAHLEGGDNFGELLRDGYAVAIFSVRGTGASGGCYDLWGAAEQRDQVALVDWASSQPWSNGRVAMGGLSYAGTTPWEAAIQSPPGLKAIMTGGIITDVYLSLSTPQGAIQDGYDAFQIGTTLANSFEPPISGDDEMRLNWAPGAKDRVCPGTVDVLTVNTLTGRGDARPKAWFDERRLADRLGDVTAAVLVAHGLRDNNFHRYQEDTIWPLLEKAPKWFILGQWEHTLDLNEPMTTFDHAKSWLDLQHAWLDFWLKGVGEPPRMGVVDYQDTSMAWHDSSAWPPANLREEAHYLAGDALSPASQGGERSFSAAPHGSCLAGPCQAVNPYCDSIAPIAGSLVYKTPPAEEAVTLAGNPFALLEIESDQAGGIFAVDLYHDSAIAGCEDARRVSDGGVDLRFFEGNFVAKAFPLNTKTTLRVDLYNVALRLEKGDQLAFVVRNPFDRDTREHAPTIKVFGASHVVLPIVEGTLGGAAPTMEYPARPFAS